METASFTGFVKTLFWIVVFYYAFRLIVRLLLPYAMKKVVEKAATQFQNQQQAYQQQQQTYQNQAQSNQKPRETKKVGEYVDFEEID